MTFSDYIKKWLSDSHIKINPILKKNQLPKNVVRKDREIDPKHLFTLIGALGDIGFKVGENRFIKSDESIIVETLDCRQKGICTYFYKELGKEDFSPFFISLFKEEDEK